jgi:hypothetical protein
MRFFGIFLFLLSHIAMACMDCGDQPPIPESEPTLLLIEPIAGIKSLEVEAVLDTNMDGEPVNVRIINKSSDKVPDTIIIKSIETVRFITQGGKVTCGAHLMKDLNHKYTFNIE